MDRCKIAFVLLFSLLLTPLVADELFLGSLTREQVIELLGSKDWAVRETLSQQLLQEVARVSDDPRQAGALRDQLQSLTHSSDLENELEARQRLQEALDALRSRMTAHYLNAWEKRDFEKAKTWILTGANVNASRRDSDGLAQIPLIELMETSRPLSPAESDFFSFLLSQGANVNALNFEKQNALAVAVRREYRTDEEISALLVHGADPNASDTYGIPPLIRALQNRREDEQQTLQIAELLFLYGAESQWKNGRGESLIDLFWSEVPWHDCDALRLLLAHGVPIASEMESPLFSAARFGREDLFFLLVQFGADLNATTKGEQTLLMAAAFGLNADIVEFLLDHGADVWQRDSNGHTPLMYVSVEGWIINRLPWDDSDIKIAEMLIKRSGRFSFQRRRYVNLENIAGETALSLCLNYRTQAALRHFLLNQGATE